MQEHNTPPQFTPDHLAESMGLKVDSLMRKMNRMGLKYNRNDVLPYDAIEQIVTEYAKPHPQRPEEVVSNAMQLAQQVNVQINIGQTVPDSYVPLSDRRPLSMSANSDSGTDSQTVIQTVPRTDNAHDGIHSDSARTVQTVGGRFVTVLSYLAFVFILLFQMEHVASISIEVSAFKEETARRISGWLFAFTFSLTALVMTIKRGARAKIRLLGKELSYILLFALLDVVFFVVSTAPTEGQSEVLKWGKAVLVGSATAFVIYSFNELVTNRQYSDSVRTDGQ